MHTAGFRSGQELNKKIDNLEEFVIEAGNLGPFTEPGEVNSFTQDVIRQFYPI